MTSMFDVELGILENNENPVWFLEIKKKSFLEGAAAILHELADMPNEIPREDGKIDAKEVKTWAQKKISKINFELNRQLFCELSYILPESKPKETKQNE